MEHKGWTGVVIGGIERRKGRAGGAGRAEDRRRGATHLLRKNGLADLGVFFFIMFI